MPGLELMSPPSERWGLRKQGYPDSREVKWGLAPLERFFTNLPDSRHLTCAHPPAYDRSGKGLLRDEEKGDGDDADRDGCGCLAPGGDGGRLRRYRRRLRRYE